MDLLNQFTKNILGVSYYVQKYWLDTELIIPRLMLINKKNLIEIFDTQINIRYIHLTNAITITSSLLMALSGYYHKALPLF